MSQNFHELARAVIIDQNHILLCKSKTEKHGFYFLPGGHVELGETSQEAVLRELFEETGISFCITKLLGNLTYSFIPADPQKACHTKENNVIFLAYAPEISLGLPLVQIEEHIELEWVPLAMLNSIDLKPKGLKALIKKNL